MTRTNYCLAVLLALAAVTTARAAERPVNSGSVPVDIAVASPRIFVPAAYAYAARVIRRAEKGNRNAEAQLGWMYATGRGVPQDFQRAAKWYYLAAVQGHGWAQFELAMLYNKGQGVPRDYIQSYMWLNLSASQAVGDDRDFKARMRDAVASKLTVAQVSLAQQMADAWYRR